MVNGQEIVVKENNCCQGIVERPAVEKAGNVDQNEAIMKRSPGPRDEDARATFCFIRMLKTALNQQRGATLFPFVAASYELVCLAPELEAKRCNREMNSPPRETLSNTILEQYVIFSPW